MRDDHDRYVPRRGDQIDDIDQSTDVSLTAALTAAQEAYRRRKATTTPTGDATSALLAAGVATVYEPEPEETTATPPTKGQRIAAELRQLADLIAQAGDDIPTPSVVLQCGYPYTTEEVTRARARADATVALLDMPPAAVRSGGTRYYDSKLAGDVRVWVYATLPDTPGTCTHCGQTCGCGGAA